MRRMNAADRNRAPRARGGPIGRPEAVSQRRADAASRIEPPKSP
jgi:hypothetical protein